MVNGESIPMENNVQVSSAPLPSTGSHAVPAQVNIVSSGNGISVGMVSGDINLQPTKEDLEFLFSKYGTKARASHAAEWACLNPGSFHLFVLESDIHGEGTFSITKEEALRYTSQDIITQVLPLSGKSISPLLNMPCLFTLKNQFFCSTPDYCPAYLGKLTDIRVQKDLVLFQYTTYKQFRQQLVNEHLTDFALQSSTYRNQLDEVHWSIRKGNLMRIAYDIGLTVE